MKHERLLFSVIGIRPGGHQLQPNGLSSMPSEVMELSQPPEPSTSIDDQTLPSRGVMDPAGGRRQSVPFNASGEAEGRVQPRRSRNS